MNFRAVLIAAVFLLGSNCFLSGEVRALTGPWDFFWAKFVGPGDTTEVPRERRERLGLATVPRQARPLSQGCPFRPARPATRRTTVGSTSMITSTTAIVRR